VSIAPSEGRGTPLTQLYRLPRPEKPHAQTNTARAKTLTKSVPMHAAVGLHSGLTTSRFERTTHSAPSSSYREMASSYANRLSESTSDFLNQTGTKNEKTMRFDFVSRGDNALDSDTVA
jgi:hypothetical protein